MATKPVLKSVEEILLKAPFKRMLPNPNWALSLTTGGDQTVNPVSNQYILVPQDVFLAEYDPAGHKINDPHYYADRLKTDDRVSPPQSYIHYVERVALPMQATIVTKQVDHVSGNYIQFVDSNPKPTDVQKTSLIEFKQGWINKNMEVAMHESFEMEKITGDTAFCGYLDNGVFGWRTFGYRNGEVLYPHFNSRTGKLSQFGRRYDQVSGMKTQNMLDVWDDTYLTTYIRDSSLIGKVKTVFGGSGWSVVSRQAHGFDFIPIAYKRDDMGACWSLVQDLIDKIELAFSQLCENNKSYAFRIMFVKGEDIDVGSVDSAGQPSVIKGDKDSDAKFLDKADASTSFELEIKMLEKYILMGSFTVLPPEVKGGDLPGVTIKLLYSPAVEKAMEDSMHWNSFLDSVVSIFKFGFGIETKKSAQFNDLAVRGEIIPYVHQNDNEIATILNQSVTMGSLSVETAAEKHPYANNDELGRITKQNEAKAKTDMAKLELTAKTKAAQAGMNLNNQNRQNAGI